MKHTPSITASLEKVEFEAHKNDKEFKINLFCNCSVGTNRAYDTDNGVGDRTYPVLNVFQLA